jgi:hypothetical protein
LRRPSKPNQLIEQHRRPRDIAQRLAIGVRVLRHVGIAIDRRGSLVAGQALGDGEIIQWLLAGARGWFVRAFP